MLVIGGEALGVRQLAAVFGLNAFQSEASGETRAAASPRFNENRNLVSWERRRLAGNSLPKIGVSIKAIQCK